jgi:hypothetical protein
MGQLIEEVKIWNTPIVGTYLLWRFTKGYIKAHPTGDAPIGLLHFLAAAILTSEKLLINISDKRENLQSFVKGFEDKKDADILINIQERVKDRLQYTMQAIDIGIAEGLLAWDVESGKLYSKEITKSPTKGNNLKPVHVKNGHKAEILGKWFSEHDLIAISSYLKVVF